MKPEVALQQVMTEFNGHKPVEDGGEVIVSDYDGVGEIEQHLENLKEDLRKRSGDARSRRGHAKKIAAMAMRFMVDRC